MKTYNVSFYVVVQEKTNPRQHPQTQLGGPHARKVHVQVDAHSTDDAVSRMAEAIRVLMERQAGEKWVELNTDKLLGGL